MNIQKSEDIPRNDRLSRDIFDRSAYGFHFTDADMTGDERIGDACQPAVPEMNIGAAHFGCDGLEQHGTVFHLRQRIASDLCRLTWSRYDGGPYRFFRIKRES